MRSSALFSVVLGAAAVLAAPANQARDDAQIQTEDITITGMRLSRKPTEAVVTSVTFSLEGSLNAGRVVECKKVDPTTSDITRCADSEYFFTLYPGENSHYALNIVHHLGVGHGLAARGDVVLSCGPDAEDPYCCKQNEGESAVITIKTV